ncbi:MAG: hypothetical protein LKM37_05470 [Bacteroidales bacterium]|nr:hypothetical protein [Bacteroidales bacterium]MCI1733954.1 hypothetical protein [Bacteroidales bacterium]
MKRRTVIFMLILAALLPLLIMREFTPSNELRYLNIADEAIANGNFFAFTDHGVPYADKPPLYFWIAIGLKSLFGKHIMFLLSLLSVIPAFVIAWIMDRWTGDKLRPEERTAGTLMLFTSLYFLASSIVLRMDMLMCMFIVLSLYEFYRMYTNKDGEIAAKNKTRVKTARQYRINRALLPVFVFLAIFSKGAVGFLVPVISILVFLAADRNLRVTGKYLGWRFWTILLCLCIAWFTGVYIDGGSSYLHNLLFNQTVNRAVNSFHHKKPFWYYGIAYWYAIAPWCILCIVAIIKGYYKRIMHGTREKLFACIAFSTIIMLSFISSKIVIYMLPAIPFFIYLMIILLPKMNNGGWIKASIAIPALLLIIAFAASLPMNQIIAKINEANLGSPLELPKLWAPYQIFTLILALGGIGALIFIKKKNLSGAIISIASSILIMLFAGSLSMRSLNKYVGIKEGCERAIKTAKANGETVCYYDFSSGPNLDYYLKQHGMKIKEIEKSEISDVKGVIVFCKTRDIRKDSLLNKKVAALPREEGGGDISIIEIPK